MEKSNKPVQIGKDKQASKTVQGEIKTQGDLTIQDYYTGHLGLFYQRPTIILMIVLSLVILADIILRYAYFKVDTSIFFWLFAIASFFFAIFGLPLVLKIQVKKLYGFNEFWAKKSHYTIGVKGVSISSQQAGSKCKWEEFKRIREYKEYFVFEINRYKVVVLPYRFLNAMQIDTLRGMIYKCTADKKVKLSLK